MDCKHTSSRLVKVIAEGTGAEMFACQCCACGNKATSWIARKLIKYPEHVAEEHTKPPTTRAMLEDERRKMHGGVRILKRLLYENYLRSPQWQHLRKQVVKRCAGLCEKCFVAPMDDVHHLTYERLGNESLADLLGVCRSCHEQLHAIAARQREAS